MQWRRLVALGLCVQSALSFPTKAILPVKTISATTAVSSGPVWPQITPAPVLPPLDRVVREIGGITDWIKSKAHQVHSAFHSVHEDVSHIVHGNISFPLGHLILHLAGVSKADVDAAPIQILNIPGYGHWTPYGWSLRVHGNVYRQPAIPDHKIDHLANIFLIGKDIEDMSPNEQDQARNLTRELFVAQQGHRKVTVDVLRDLSFGSFIQHDHKLQSTVLPFETTPEGDFDALIDISDAKGVLQQGLNDVPPQKLNVYAQGAASGNATSYLVANKGLTVVSDIDDILRVTKIYQPKQGLMNTFAHPFTPWMNMPSIYANWSRSLPTIHFHYLTTTPEQGTRAYMQFIYNTYPGGSFDTRPLNFTDLKATLHIRQFLLDKIFQTYPLRKFILVGDTTNPDVMSVYPEMAKRYPKQIQCIFVRNTVATDPQDHFPYNTAGFKGLDRSKYMFFNVPDDLTGLDIAQGHCVNATVEQDVTFGLQNLPFDLSGDHH